MKFQKSIEADINNIIKIIKQAQDYFKDQGINQWQNNYPNYETIKNDINKEESYVLIEDNEILGTAAVSFNGEKTYDNIHDGKWLSKKDFAVIHRIAVNNNFKGRGLAGEIIKNVEKLCLDKGIHSIKMDTHEENISMQNSLKKNGFKYCGVIYLEDKSKRIAFEKLL